MMDRLADRWQRRQEGQPQQHHQQPYVTVAVSEQVTVAGVDPGQLWQLVWDPATSPLVLDHVVAAFTVPGTPAGKVGEMQMHIVRGARGTLVGMIEEVVEIGPGYRAVTRSRSAVQPTMSTTTLLPLDQGGCVLRHHTELTAPQGSATAVRAEAQASSLRYLSRVRDLAERTLRTG